MQYFSVYNLFLPRLDVVIKKLQRNLSSVLVWLLYVSRYFSPVKFSKWDSSIRYPIFNTKK